MIELTDQGSQDHYRCKICWHLFLFAMKHHQMDGTSSSRPVAKMSTIVNIINILLNSQHVMIHCNEDHILHNSHPGFNHQRSAAFVHLDNWHYKIDYDSKWKNLKTCAVVPFASLWLSFCFSNCNSNHTFLGVLTLPIFWYHNKNNVLLKNIPWNDCLLKNDLLPRQVLTSIKHTGTCT